MRIAPVPGQGGLEGRSDFKTLRQDPHFSFNRKAWKATDYFRRFAVACLSIDHRKMHGVFATCPLLPAADVMITHNLKKRGTPCTLAAERILGRIQINGAAPAMRTQYGFAASDPAYVEGAVETVYFGMQTRHFKPAKGCIKQGAIMLMYEYDAFGEPGKSSPDIPMRDPFFCESFCFRIAISGKQL